MCILPSIYRNGHSRQIWINRAWLTQPRTRLPWLIEQQKLTMFSALSLHPQTIFLTNSTVFYFWSSDFIFECALLSTCEPVADRNKNMFEMCIKTCPRAASWLQALLVSGICICAEEPLYCCIRLRCADRRLLSSRMQIHTTLLSLSLTCSVRLTSALAGSLKRSAQHLALRRLSGHMRFRRMHGILGPEVSRTF